MDFKTEMAERTAQIEQIIKKYLPKEEGYQKTIMEAMNYSVLAGGKRLRPMLMQETYRLFGGRSEVIEPFMAAIEMIHTYSLVHDDLPAMDNDEYRRGKKTTHAVYGEAMGILAGDALLNYAYETAARAFAMEPGNPGVCQAFQILTAKAGIYGMVGGQTVDIEGTAQTVEQLTGMCMMKTGALIKCAVRLGCLSVGADEASMAQADIYADAIGLAFQIRDDILDVIGSTEELGKPVGSDAEQQKATFATVLGTERAQSLAEKLTRTALDALKQLNVAEDDPLYEMTVELCSRKK